jgi:hypothetical protein
MKLLKKTRKFECISNIFLPVSDMLRGYPANHAVRLYIMRHDRTASDDRTATDMYARQYRNPRTYGNIIVNHHIAIYFPEIRIVYIMLHGEYPYVAGYGNVISNTKRPSGRTKKLTDVVSSAPAMPAV